MTEHDYHELPRGVRERYDDLKDVQFADHPDVVAARERVASHQAKHRASVERNLELSARIEQLLLQQREARAQLEALGEARPKVIADALLLSDDLTADKQLLQRCADLAHRVEAIDKGMPMIREEYNRAMERSRGIVMSMDGDEECLRNVLDGLKLAEAWRQHNA